MTKLGARLAFRPLATMNLFPMSGLSPHLLCTGTMVAASAIFSFEATLTPSYDFAPFN